MKQRIGRAVRRLTGLLLVVLLLPCGAAQADETAVEAERGMTTFGVISSDELSNVSFSVPLYATIAVINNGGTATVISPSAKSYCLTNTGQSGYVAVSKLTVQGVGDQPFRLISGADTYTGTRAAIALEVGGQGFPAGEVIPEKTDDTVVIDKEALLAGSSDFVYQRTWLEPDPEGTLDDEGNVVQIEKSEMKLRPIKAKVSVTDKNTLPITLSGTVSASWLTNDNPETDSISAAPHWKLKYTVSRCDSVGNLLDTTHVYSGAPSNYTDYVWNADTKAFEKTA